MTFRKSVEICLGPDYFFKFRGRASRSEFWWFMLFIFLVQCVMIVLESILPIAIMLPILFIIPLLLLPANLGVTVRRFHDRNLSGWWLLLPILMYIMWILNGPGSQAGSLLSLAASIGYLAILCMPSQERPNKYGPPPAEALKV